MLSPQNGSGLVFRDARLPARVVHLDTAAAGRSSVATLQAVKSHMELEATNGGYVAQAEAAPVIDQGRRDLAELLAVEPVGVAFTESASAARDALLGAWRFGDDDTVAVVASEWGPNLAAFEHRGLRITELAADSDGIVDLGALERFLATTPPTFVNLTHVASHRPLVQPVAKAAALCRAVGVPLWVDVAQALGHVDTASGADVLYGTSRKWLTGPRGVGVLAVARPYWDKLRISVSAMDLLGVAPDDPPIQLMESREANVAGRVGLANALREHLRLGPETVWNLLAQVGKATRAALSDIGGWEVVGDTDAPSAITVLRPRDGQDVAQVRARLLAEHRILTTRAHRTRAPREMTTSYLRVSPHIDCQESDLELLRKALTNM